MLSKNQDIDIGQNKHTEIKEHRRRKKNQRPSGSHIQESHTKVDWKPWYICRGPEANPYRPCTYCFSVGEFYMPYSC